jgi:DNA topoisomerase-3
MQKLISKKLKINSHTTMDIAEKLYQKGLISYPRTETNVFNPSINLLTFIEEQKKSSIWGNYASRLLDGIFEVYERI